jgi:hypothetical protein
MMAKRLKRQFAVECLAESVLSILDDKDASDLTKSEWLATTFDQFEAHVAKLAPEPLASDDDEPTEDGDSTLPPKLEQFLVAMLEADPKLRQDEALSYLLHSRHGRQLGTHLSTITKEAPMSRTEVLRTVTKEHGGVVALCKTIATTGDSIGVTEAELTKLIDDEAQKTRKRPEAKRCLRVFLQRARKSRFAQGDRDHQGHPHDGHRGRADWR